MGKTIAGTRGAWKTIEAARQSSDPALLALFEEVYARVLSAAGANAPDPETVPEICKAVGRSIRATRKAAMRLGTIEFPAPGEPGPVESLRKLLTDALKLNEEIAKRALRGGSVDTGYALGVEVADFMRNLSSAGHWLAGERTTRPNPKADERRAQMLKAHRSLRQADPGKLAVAAIAIKYQPPCADAGEWRDRRATWRKALLRSSGAVMHKNRRTAPL